MPRISQTQEAFSRPTFCDIIIVTKNGNFHEKDENKNIVIVGPTGLLGRQLLAIEVAALVGGGQWQSLRPGLDIGTAKATQRSKKFLII